MALHFVSTSVLSSKDGIDFSVEEAVESEEAKNVGYHDQYLTYKHVYIISGCFTIRRDYLQNVEK
jgi:hypothetical protein